MYTRLKIGETAWSEKCMDLALSSIMIALFHQEVIMLFVLTSETGMVVRRLMGLLDTKKELMFQVQARVYQIQKLPSNR